MAAQSAKCRNDPTFQVVAAWGPLTQPIVLAVAGALVVGVVEVEPEPVAVEPHRSFEVGDLDDDGDETVSLSHLGLLASG